LIRVKREKGSVYDRIQRVSKDALNICLELKKDVKHPEDGVSFEVSTSWSMLYKNQFCLIHSHTAG
jgi:hypothetical protein